MIVDRINEYLSGEGHQVSDGLLSHIAELSKRSFVNQFGPPRKVNDTIHLSSIGHCLRQQAYKLLGTPPNGKEIDSRSKMVFFQGDMVEIAMMQLARVAGCRITACGLGQMSVELDGVWGHPDGILFENQKIYLVECKSMSSYSFERFQENNIDQGYVYQINAYLEALGLTDCIVLGLNKDSGVIHEQTITKDPGIAADIKKRIEILKLYQSPAIAPIDENKETVLPDRPYTPNEKGFYPWQCLYCAFWRICLPNVDRVLVRNAYRLKLKEEEKTNELISTPTP